MVKSVFKSYNIIIRYRTSVYRKPSFSVSCVTDYLAGDQDCQFFGKNLGSGNITAKMLKTVKTKCSG